MPTTRPSVLANATWALVEHAWYPLLLFATTPFFLQRLGAEQYGFWMLTLAAVGLGGVLSAGTAAATVREVAAAFGRGDCANAARKVSAGLAIAAIGGCVLVALLLAMHGLAGERLLGRMGSPALLGLSAAAAAGLLWLEQLDSICTAALRGAERFALAAGIEVASKTLQIAGGVLAVLVWPRLWMLYGVLGLVALLRLLAKALAVRHCFPGQSLRPRMAGAAELFALARWGWVQGVGGVLFGVADRLLIGGLLGASSLAYYAIATQLAQQVHAFAAAACGALLPAMSRTQVLRDGPAAAHGMLAALGVNAAFVVILAALALGAGPTLVHWWLEPPAAEVVAGLLPWLVLAYFLLALNAAPHFILLSLGRFRYVSLTNLSAGIVLAALLPWTIEHHGLDGVAMSRIVYGAIIMANAWPLARYIAEARRG